MRIKMCFLIKPKENFNINTVIEYLKKELNIIGWDIEEGTLKYTPKVYDQLEGFKHSDLWDSFEYVMFKTTNKYDLLQIPTVNMALSAIQLIANETNLFEVYINSFNCI